MITSQIKWLPTNKTVTITDPFTDYQSYGYYGVGTSKYKKFITFKIGRGDRGHSGLLNKKLIHSGKLYSISTMQHSSRSFKQRNVSGKNKLCGP